MINDKDGIKNLSFLPTSKKIVITEMEVLQKR